MNGERYFTVIYMHISQFHLKCQTSLPTSYIQIIFMHNRHPAHHRANKEKYVHIDIINTYTQIYACVWLLCAHSVYRYNLQLVSHN